MGKLGEVSTKERFTHSLSDANAEERKKPKKESRVNLAGEEGSRGGAGSEVVGETMKSRKKRESNIAVCGGKVKE